LEAATGVAARSLCLSESRPIDLLLTDNVIPGGISGTQLAAEMSANNPGLKVVLTSGYSASLAGTELEPGRIFLQKPASATEILATVRRALDN
jgi:DNA-binding NtrC family response regulator